MSPAPQSRMLAERGTSLTCSQMHTNTCASATCLPLRASPRAWRRLAPPWSWSLLGGVSPAGTCFGKAWRVCCSSFEASQEQCEGCKGMREDGCSGLQTGGAKKR